MKRFLYSLLIACCVVPSQPSCWVYLEHADEGEGIKERVVRVDFSDLEVEEGLGIERTRKRLEGKALSFTETTTITTESRGHFTHFQREKDFFTSPQVKTFIDWIAGCSELKRLEFLGVDTEAHIESVRQALLRIVDHQRSTLEDGFVLIEHEEPLIEDKSAVSLDRFDSSVSLKEDLRTKFKKVRLKCTGQQAGKAKREMNKILRTHEKYLQNFIIEN